MKKILFLLLCVIVLLVNAPTVYPQDDSSCPGAPPTRLIAGKRGRVTSGPANNVRADPTTESTVLGQLAGRSFFLVLDGPVCADGFAWWQIESGNLIGWTAEGQDESYWLEPLHTITPENAAQVQQIATLGLDGELLGWSPNGETLAILTGGGVKLVDYDHFSALPMRQFDTDRSVRTAAISPDWSVLATQADHYRRPDVEYDTPPDNSVRLWDVATGELLRVLEGPTGWVEHLAFSLDGRYLLAGNHYDTASPTWVWDVTTGQPLNAPDGYGFVTDFDLNGNLYVMDQADALWVWDIHTGEIIGSTPLVEAGKIHQFLTFSPDRTRLITSSQDGGADILDLTTGVLLRHFDGIYAGVDWTLGRLVTWDSLDVLVYSLASGSVIATLSTNNPVDGFPLYVGWVEQILFSVDGRLMALRGIGDPCSGSVIIWDTQTEEMLFNQQGCVTSMLFQPSTHNLLFSSGNIFAWDAETGTADLLTGNARDFIHIWVSANGRLAAASDTTWYTPRIHLWDATNWTELETITNSSAVLALSPDGQSVAYAGWTVVQDEWISDGTVHLWDAFTGEEVGILRADEGAQLQNLAFNVDGTVVAALGIDDTQEQHLWTWDVIIGEQQETIDPALRDQLFQTVSRPEWQEMTRPYWMLGTPSRLPVSPDGLFMAAPCSWQGDGLCLLDATTQERVSELEAVPGFITHAAFSPDGRLVAAVSGYQDYDAEGQLYIWDVETGELLAAPKGHVGAAWSVIFSPDGTLILSGGGGCWACEGYGSTDTAVRIWAVP